MHENELFVNSVVKFGRLFIGEFMCVRMKDWI